MYATMRAAGKNTKLNKKYPKKLCPLRRATRAGQNASRTHATTKTIDMYVTRKLARSMTFPLVVCEANPLSTRSCAVSRDVSRTQVLRELAWRTGRHAPGDGSLSRRVLELAS